GEAGNRGAAPPAAEATRSRHEQRRKGPGGRRRGCRAAAGPARRTIRLDLQLEDVEPAGEAVDGVDDLPLVHEDVVELDGPATRLAGGRRHVEGDLLRAEGAGQG